MIYGVLKKVISEQLNEAAKNKDLIQFNSFRFEFDEGGSREAKR